MPNKISRYAEGVMEACWLLALIASPLFFDIYSSRVFEPDKVTLVRSLALVTLAAWAVKIMAEGGIRFEHIATAGRSRLSTLMRQPLVLPVTIFMAVYLISTTFSVAPATSWLGSYQRLQGTFSTFSYIALFGAVAVNLRRRAQVERLLTTVILTSLPVSLYGILQRRQQDPLPWGGDTTTRVTANLGNAIFIGAYLIMPTFAALGRVVTYFRAILMETENVKANVVRATLYVIILAVNLIAIFFCNSRGPWLGLLAGMFFFFVMLALHWRNNILGLSGIALATAGAAFILVLNIPNGPLNRLSQTPALGRLASMMGEIEGRTGTGQVRVLIWTGVVNLMTPHPPLEFPDGHVDAFNAIRPLIGYGPEGLYVAFNRFYPPALGQIEARNASPDRSHNETFDALAFTGVLGLTAQFLLFVAVFYYALKWAGLVGSPRRRAVYLTLVLGSGLVTAAVFIVWQGPQFFGVGLPVGMLLGLIAFLTIYALVAMLRQPADSAPAAPALEPWRAIVLISLFAAIVAHFTEIHFGIAIASTRTHFWIFSALMLVVGFALPAETAPKETPAVALPAGSETRSRRRLRVTASAARATPNKWGPVFASAGIMAAILITLGFDYISNPLHSTQPGQILWEAFTALASGPTIRPYGILGLILITWLAGGVLAYLEELPSSTGRPRAKDLATGLGISLLVGGFSWILQATQHAAIAGTVPNSMATLFQSTDTIANLLTSYYLQLLALILVWAVMLPADWPDALSQGQLSIPAVIGFVMLPMVALVASNLLNLQIIQADIIYKTAMQFDAQGQPQVAVPVFQRALERSPNEDYYYLFLGRAYLNLTGTLTDPTQRENTLNQAEAELKRAQQLNPLNTDHTANLARLNSQWALLSTTPDSRQKHIDISDQYYQKALKLSPNNVGLWVEWGKLTLQLQNKLPETQQIISHTLDLDPTYVPDYQLQGDFYTAQARATTDLTAQQGFFNQAISAYQTGLKLGQDAGLVVGLANAYEATSQLKAAIDQYQLLVSMGAPGIEPWRVYRRMGELSQALNDSGQAHIFATQALSLAPEANKAEIQTWIQTLP
jgi:tetratricopeptide (TPR) repeat protein